MKQKVMVQWAAAIVFFVIIFGLFLSVFLSPEKPVRNAQIPQQTKDYFTEMLGQFEFDIQFVDFFDKDDWLNDNDFGQDTVVQLAQLEDDNFIVYFDSTEWEQHHLAVLALKLANNNIGPLDSLFGNYIYPAQVRGRKLAIYLAPSGERFIQVYQELTGKRENTEWMAGVCITNISQRGEVLTQGLLLKTYGASAEPREFLLTLKHEMAHYVHFNSVDWLTTHPLLWETEGFAKYFEGEANQMKALAQMGTQTPSEINLTTDVKAYIDSYWVGYSVMLFMEQEYSRAAVTRYIQNNYTLGAKENIETTSLMNVNAFERRWKGFVGQYF